jgi:hypothetical protein
MSTFPAFTVKAKTCTAPGCDREFIPARPLQAVCGPVCARRKVEAAKRAERESVKARKRAIATPKELIPLAQEWFNRFIRLRDRDKGCFVCGKPFPVGKLGGDFDAGHVRSRGAAKHLRFNEDNCHGECKECNASWGAKPHQIEAGAIRRIGQERYDALKNNNEPYKWRKQELLDLIAHYKAKCKELENQ